jgi:hypothetical protein
MPEPGAMAYIRRRYKVPAKRGVTIFFQGRPGVILSADNGHLWVRLDHAVHGPRVKLHPTWEVDYD